MSRGYVDLVTDDGVKPMVLVESFLGSDVLQRFGDARGGLTREMIKDAEERFMGSAQSVPQFLKRWFIDQGYFANDDGALLPYVDFEQMALDTVLNGELEVVVTDAAVYLFTT
jgi:hypothetical protein